MGFKIIKYIDIDYFDKTLFIYYFNHFFPYVYNNKHRLQAYFWSDLGYALFLLILEIYNLDANRDVALFCF